MLAARRLQAISRTLSRHSKFATAAAVHGSNALQLYTAGTPNGWKVAILLEELKIQYGLQVNYDVHKISFAENEQKQPWYLDINPNGRIPALVDKNRNNFAVFESAAILLYLEQHYDPLLKFSYDATTQPEEYSQMLQWIFFTHGGIGPMQGQLNHFHRVAPEDIPYAKKRYLDETKRLYSVLDTRLIDREWLVGAGSGIYSIADMNAFPWVNGHSWGGIETLDEWPNVKAWIGRCAERPGVQSGIQVP